MNVDRRQVLQLGASLSGGALLGAPGAALAALATEVAPDFRLRIAPHDVELAPGVVIRTTAYNAQVPGPLLRLQEGRPVTIEVTNASDVAELVHWHGLQIPSPMDGAMEEGSPMIAPGARFRYRFTPRPAGTRWYHSHAMAQTRLDRAGYTGQFGFLIVEPRSQAGAYDQEVLLAVHHWEPAMVMASAQMADCDIGYRYASFNDRLLAHSEPIRVKRGQRVLFRFLNASATEAVTLALPHHRFTVVAMDGNPVPNPRSVSQLYLGVAERIDAIVEMDSPGVWVLGPDSRSERAQGLGRVIEYAGMAGAPVWSPPRFIDWDYTQFGQAAPAVAAEAIALPMLIRMAPGESGTFGRWTINGRSYPDIAPLEVRHGRRYRLAFTNHSHCPHPVHLHRHSFELVSFAGRRSAGLIKDVLSLPTYATAEVDFVADNPGPFLFHCHQQQHMDAGFMQLLKYV